MTTAFGNVQAGTRQIIKGILGHKLGMTQVFDENNRVVPVTVVAGGPERGHRRCAPRRRTATRAVQLAFGAIDPRKVNKPETGHFAKAGITPRRHLVELRTSDAGEYAVGQEITADRCSKPARWSTWSAPARARAPRVS